MKEVVIDCIILCVPVELHHTNILEEGWTSGLCRRYTHYIYCRIAPIMEVNQGNEFYEMVNLQLDYILSVKQAID